MYAQLGNFKTPACYSDTHKETLEKERGMDNNFW